MRNRSENYEKLQASQGNDTKPENQEFTTKPAPKYMNNHDCIYFVS